MLARDLKLLHPELMDRLDALGPEGAELELSRWRALYALEAREHDKKNRPSGRGGRH